VQASQSFLTAKDRIKLTATLTRFFFVGAGGGGGGGGVGCDLIYSIY
jgi:hypothetical protein